MSNLEIACDEIPNAVTNALVKPPNYYDCKCDIGFEGPETFMPDDSDAKCIGQYVFDHLKQTFHLFHFIFN
jgi:hypothetical protein